MELDMKNIKLDLIAVEPIIMKSYVIDFDKVTSFEDIKAILNALNITIHEQKYIAGIEHLVKEIKD